MTKNAMSPGDKGKWRTALLVSMYCAGSSAWASCTLSLPLPPFMKFGNYQPLTLTGKLNSADKDSVATVSVECSDEANYTVSLGEIGGSTNPRQMINQDRPGAPRMNFNIFLDPQRSIIWGDGMSGQVLSGSTGVGGGINNHTVYGRIPAGQHTLQAGENYSSGPGTITLIYNP